jgi:hypothetical protein
MSAETIIELIRSKHFGYATEQELQQQMWLLLTSSGLDVIREYRLSQRDRVDFIVRTETGNVAIECKIKGASNTIVSQLSRYAESSEVAEIILVSSKRVHIASEAFREKTILGKPLFGVWIGGFA